MYLHKNLITSTYTLSRHYEPSRIQFLRFHEFSSFFNFPDFIVDSRPRSSTILYYILIFILTLRASYSKFIIKLLATQFIWILEYSWEDHRKYHVRVLRRSNFKILNYLIFCFIWFLYTLVCMRLCQFLIHFKSIDRHNIIEVKDSYLRI